MGQGDCQSAQSQNDRGVNTRPLTHYLPPIGQVEQAGWHTGVTGLAAHSGE